MMRIFGNSEGCHNQYIERLMHTQYLHTEIPIAVHVVQQIHAELLLYTHKHNRRIFTTDKANNKRGSYVD